MPNIEYAQTMAQYNSWQNDSLTRAANTLTDAQRRADQGVFFGSIQKTFSHILWGDQLWLSRFAGTTEPIGGIGQSANLFDDWDLFCTERARFDAVILDWAQNADPSWFSGDLRWFSGAINRDITKPKSLLSIQLFNHQTHHRGQIHAMLTALGACPDDTGCALYARQLYGALKANFQNLSSVQTQIIGILRPHVYGKPIRRSYRKILGPCRCRFST